MSWLTLNKASINPGAPGVSRKRLWLENANLGRYKAIDGDTGATEVLSADGWHDKNNVANGHFAIAQRQLATTLTTYSNVGGRSYGPDRWGLSNENASLQFQTVYLNGAVETGTTATSYGKFKKITTGGKMVIAQVVEGVNMNALRGRNVRLQVSMKRTIAATMVVKIGLAQLTAAGTGDTIPSGAGLFVTAFNGVGTDPTLGANLSYIVPTFASTEQSFGTAPAIVNNGVQCTLTGAWVRFSGVFAVPSTAKNLIIMIWTDGQPAALDELNITEVGLYDGVEVKDWVEFPLAYELMVAQRYYFKTFGFFVAPAQSAGLNGALHWMAGKAGALAEGACGHLRFPQIMRTTTPTLTGFNPSAANALVRDVTGAVDTTAQAFADTSDCGTSSSCTGNAATAVGNVLALHVTADAEL